ncbi:MAG: hydrophobe/amphiphile efflux-3 (HAE3) family transporter [Archaeoglobaceae archaeon]|nr:hydrophobe/amphiphile efflux-3 (HAE3) family transporter [Archaeoglobaceae archaeon]MDW8118154.1 hydrophobe/amphiphile efflux-3 (HAE3) family transporter [Archaeoglobaceae archaeon]
MKLLRIVSERPGIVFIFVFIVILFSMYSAMNVEMTSGTESFFSKDNKVYQQYKLYEKNFVRATGAVFLLIKGEDVVNHEAYQFMLTLGEELKKIEGVESVTSPASIMEDYLGGVPTDERLLKELSELYISELIPKPTLAMVMVQIVPTGTEEEQEGIARNIEKSIENMQIPTGYTVEITGSPVLGYQIKGEILKSLGITMMAAVVLMILFLFGTFSGVVRRKWTAFLPLVISISAVIIIYGMMPRLGIPLSEHTNGALPMLVGLSIEYAVQIQNRFEEEIRKHGVDTAIELAVERTGRAVVLALLTTIVGFMSMLTVGIPAMAWFGIIASLGLIVAYILSITFLPAILKIIEVRKKKVEEEKEWKEEKARLEKVLSIVSSLTASRPYGILVVAVIISVFGFYVSPMLELETNYNKYVPQNLPSIQKFSELEELVGGQTIYTLVLETDGVDSRVLEKSKELADYILSKEELIYSYQSVNSLAEAYGGLDNVPEEQLSRYVSGSTLAVHFYSTADTHEEFKNTLNSIYKDIDFYGWEGNYFVTGQAVIYSELGSIMIESQTMMTLVAYIGILILLLVIYRSVRKAIVPLITITSVIGVMNLIMFISGVKQTMVSIALNSIILGLGIDFSIMITERYLEERQKASAVEAVRRAIEHTGKATTTSALAMIGGFGALMLSTFPVMRDFGFLSLVAISFSLIAAFTVVPAFLMVTEKLGEKLKANNLVGNFVKNKF